MTKLPSAEVERKDNKKTKAKRATVRSEPKPLADGPARPIEQADPGEQWRSPEIRSADALVKIPLQIAINADEYFPRRTQVNLRQLSRKQRFGLQVLTQGAKLEGTMLENGGEVRNHVSALRSLLEAIADAAKENLT